LKLSPKNWVTSSLREVYLNKAGVNTAKTFKQILDWWINNSSYTSTIAKNLLYGVKKYYGRYN
jgi:hypothetical protein